jgi:transposase-like protein
MSKTRKFYSVEFKAKVILELISSDQTLNQIASKYAVTPQRLLAWKKQFLENASQALSLQRWCQNTKKR